MIAWFIHSLFWVSLTGGVFILAAILVRAGVKHRLPKQFLVLLWAAVLLHFIFMQGTPSPTSIYNYVHFSGPVAPPSASLNATQPPSPVAEAAANTSTAAPTSSPGIGASGVLFAIWVAGAVAMLGIFIGNYLFTSRRFADAILLKNQSAIEAWRSRRRRPPDVYASDRTTTPLAMGFLRPRIILPSGLDLSNAPLVESVLEHEHVHCRHFHNALKVLVYLAVALHWFNPLVWLCWLLFNHDIELACDERVIRVIGPEKRAEYAHSLVAVAEKAIVPLPLISAFSARSLKERIVDIMGYKRSTTLLVATEFGLAAALFAVFGTAPSSLGLAAGPGVSPPAATVPRRPMPAGVIPPDDADTAGMENARREALARYPQGRVRGCELKRRHSGGYVYEVDMEVDGKGRTVEIDASGYAGRRHGKGMRHSRGH